MRRKIFGLALLTVSGVALAQTNLTIYGVVDAAITYDNNVSAPDGDRTWRLQSGQQSGSRIGFRGREDLGGGLGAIFTLENGFNIDDGTLGQGNRIFGRQAWVGLNGGFGEVRLGRQQTPLYYALNEIDPFKINMAGNSQRIFGSGLYLSDPLNRSDNTVTYATPSFGGLGVSVGYGFGETPGDTSTGRQLLAGASYVNGPINLQFAFQGARDATLATSAAALATGVADLRTAFLGGSYDFGMAKAHLGFAETRIEPLAGDEVKNRNYLVGASVPLGAGTVLASYIRNDARDIDEGKSDQYAVGYTHPLSKRTNLYTSYSYTKNDDAVRVNAFAPGESGHIFNVGVRHQF